MYFPLHRQFSFLYILCLYTLLVYNKVHKHLISKHGNTKIFIQLNKKSLYSKKIFYQKQYSEVVLSPSNMQSTKISLLKHFWQTVIQKLIFDRQFNLYSKLKRIMREIIIFDCINISSIKHAYLAEGKVHYSKVKYRILSSSLSLIHHIL